MTRTAAARLLAFGFMLTLLSSFGQTFFIGLFSEALQGAAELGDGAFGTLYSGATLASAGCVFWAGALIDRVALRAYVSGVVLLLAAGCVIVGLAEHIALLGVALFLLRFAGQGLLTHTAVTTLARSFTKRRGKALSVALLGHPAGEAALPLAAVALAGAFGWRSVWLLAAGVVLAAIPVLLWLCGRPGERPPRPAAAAAGGASRAEAGGSACRGGADDSRAGDGDGSRDASRREVLRDRAFHLLLPTLLLPGFVATGVFIHQARLVAEKDWTLAWFAASFMAFAAAQVAGMLGSGPLIDRLSARRLAPFYLLPLGAACIAAGLIDHRLIAPVFMAGAGFTNGAAASIGTALWAELYGITHLGAIRALAASTMVLSTALAPALFGWLLEAGVRFGPLLLGCAAAVGAAAVLARTGLRHLCS